MSEKREKIRKLLIDFATVHYPAHIIHLVTRASIDQATAQILAEIEKKLDEIGPDKVCQTCLAEVKKGLGL